MYLTCCIYLCWKECIDLMDRPSGFEYVIGRIFVKKNYANSTTRAISEMISRLSDSFIWYLRSVEWMDKESRSLSEKIISNMSKLIGYPEFIMNDTEINNLYFLLVFRRKKFTLVFFFF